MEARGCVSGNIAHGALVRSHLGFLGVHRKCQVGDSTTSERRPYSQVRGGHDVRRPHNPLVVEADVLEDVVEIDVLLVVGANQIVVGHADDGQDGRLIQLASYSPFSR